MPLGTVAEIHASVVAGNMLRTKTYQGSYLLRVSAFDGRPLAPAPVMELVVYETGTYSGIPDLPNDLPAWQDHGFGFSTSLVVLAERQ